MKRPGSKETANEKAAGADADKAENPASSSNSEAPSDATPQPWPNTAIERQIAKASVRRSRKRVHQEMVSPINARRKPSPHTRRRKPHRFGLASFLVFFLLVAAGLAWVLTDPERPLQKAISRVWPMVRPTAVPPNPTPVGAAQTPAPKVAEVSTPTELAIPIADISLRNRPELLAQLVQIYRSKIAGNPNDTAALTALNRLQERSLSELETMIVEGGDAATAAKSLQDVARLFPELADNPRYQYLNTRIDLRATEKPADKPEPSTPLAKTTSPDKTPSLPEKGISPEKNISSKKNSASPEKPIAPEKAVSPAQTVSAPPAPSDNVAKKTTKNPAQPSKPEVRTVSITPGRMVDDQFIPSAEGNVLMVGISYRNFEKIADDQSDVMLVTRLGIPGDSTVLAEVPIVISGDRGSKSFLIETLMPGDIGGKYQLNFLVNGEFLTSRVVRLSMPQ